jgi:hypothetical protein
MQRLIAELHRLFPLPAAAQPEATAAEAASVAASLQRQLAGDGWVELQPVDAQGCTRLLGLGFHGVARGQGAAHCAAMLRLARWLMEELGLPESAFSVNGRDGFELWLPLAAPVPVGEAYEFVQLLQSLQLPELQPLRLWPAAPQPASAGEGGLRLPPGRHADTGLWSVFISPGLAPSFEEEAGIDIAPNLDKQAELLSRLQPIAPADFALALRRLRQRAGQPDGAGASAPATPAPGGAAASGTPLAGAARAETSAAAPASAAVGPLAGLREALFEALTRPAPVMPSPLEGLTQLLRGGWRAGRLYLLQGTMEAAATLAAMALEQAAMHGHPALYLGHALSRVQFVQAALARRLGLEAWRIEAGALTAQEGVRLAAGLEAWLAQVGPQLEVREAASGTALAEVAVWVGGVRAAAPGRTPVVVIDPLRLACTGNAAIDAHPDAGYREAALAAACKHLACSAGVAVIAVASRLQGADPLITAQGGGDPAAQALPDVADTVIRLQPPPDRSLHGMEGPLPLRLWLHSRFAGAGELALCYWPARQALEAVLPAGHAS